MNEKQLTERMSLAVLDEPPLGFDPDEVIDGVVRRRRRNALAATSGTAAVLVAVTAVAFGGTGPQRSQPGASPAPSPTPSTSEVVVDPGMNPGRCPISLPEVVPPLLAEHFPGAEFDPVPEPHTDPSTQYWLNLLGDNQQFVDVVCRSGPAVLTEYEPEPEYVVDEERPGGAHLRVHVREPFENRPPPVFGEWRQGDELTLEVKVYGGDKLTATPEQVAALTAGIAAKAG